MSFDNFIFYCVGFLFGHLEYKFLPVIEKKIDSFIERRRKKNV